jgi:hypothetical protein
MVFVSNARFHREMWRATSGVHTFVWGQDLKDDLRRRIAMRAEIKQSTEDTTKVQDDSKPVGAPASVIAEMWRTYMRATGKSDQSERAKAFEDLDPEIQRQFKDAMKQFDRMDQARRR